MNKKPSITFFIEGQEHVRFVEEYIIISKYLGFGVKIASLENLNLNIKIDEIEVNVIKKNDLRKYFKNINTEWVFTTTPGVGSFYFPKSKNNNIKNKTQYVYVFHSLVSPNQVYIENSFKNFDVILSPNELITEQLKFVSSKKVKIITVGYPVLNQYKDDNKSPRADNVLIAPSWGDDSFLFDYEFMNTLTTDLLRNESKIIVRPHPMHIDRLKNDNKFEMLDINFDFNKNLNNLNDFSLLITDWSGIALEYYYLTKGKIVFIDGLKKIRRKLTKKENTVELIEDKIRNKIGIVIKKDENIENIRTKNFSITQRSEEYIQSLYTPKFNSQNVAKIIENFINI